MADPHVITALVKRRAELAGDLDKVDGERRAVLASLANIDATLALFDYEGEPQSIPTRRRHKRRIFRRGELQRTVFDIVRERPNLATNREIAAEIIRRKGWSTTNLALLDSIARKVKDVKKRGA